MKGFLRRHSALQRSSTSPHALLLELQRHENTVRLGVQGHHQNNLRNVKGYQKGIGSATRPVECPHLLLPMMVIAGVLFEHRNMTFVHVNDVRQRSITGVYVFSPWQNNRLDSCLTRLFSFTLKPVQFFFNICQSSVETSSTGLLCDIITALWFIFFSKARNLAAQLSNLSL